MASGTASSPLKLRILGGFDLQGPAGSVRFESAKTSALFAYLALQPGSHTRSKLAGLFWGELSEERALANLRRGLWDQRAKLSLCGAGECLITGRREVGLQPGASLWIDAVDFEGALASGASGGPSAPGSTKALEEALALYRGNLLDGLSVDQAPGFEEWLCARREHLRSLASAARLRIADLLESEGRVREALRHARALVDMDPWVEEGHRVVMRLLELSGETAAALRQYEALRRVLAEELNTLPSPETEALRLSLAGRAPADAKRASHSHPSRPEPSEHNLPPQATPFVGREEEIAALLTRLLNPACRLLTLLGPGGMGKTRLAVQTALRAVSSPARDRICRDGVWFVPLADVEEPVRVPSAVASALGLEAPGSPDVESRLAAHLKEKELLLVLDTFEHLLPAALWAADLLRRCPGLKLLVTSRERLDLLDEWVSDVRGLGLPAGGPPESALRSDAVRLFLQCARRANLGLEAGPAELASVVRICARLEGMPLGIELAAAWARNLSLGEIAAEIDLSFDFLSSSAQDLPERQRSLRAIFDHSWQRMPLREREALAALSVFEGGFQREAAAAVAGAAPHLLSRLMDKSLVVREPTGRYHLHHVLRQYAAEMLAQTPRAREGAQAGHAAHYLNLLSARGARSPDAHGEWAHRTTGEVGNVHAAWNGAVAARDGDSVSEALEGFTALHETMGLFEEGLDYLERTQRALAGWTPPAGESYEDLSARILVARGILLNRVGRFRDALALCAEGCGALEASDDARSLGRGLCAWGEACRGTGDYALAASKSKASLTLAREAGDLETVSLALDQLGQICRETGAFDEARGWLEEALGMARAIGDRAVSARILNELGYVASYQGALDESQSFREAALSAAREAGDRSSAALALSGLAVVAFFRGSYERATEMLEESLAICRAISDRHGEARALSNLGENAREQGAFEEALAFDRQAAAIFEELGAVQGLAIPLINQGLSLLGLGRLGEARDLLRQALGISLGIGTLPLVLVIISSFGRLLAAEGREEEALELLGFALSNPSTTLDIRREADRVFSSLGQGLSDDARQAALARGRGASLEAITARLLGDRA
jgi:predicted ATPase/DNA-binding SARP family transcriptional activator